VQHVAFFGQELFHFLALAGDLILLFRQVALNGLEFVFLAVDVLELLIKQVAALLDPPLVLPELAPALLDLRVHRLAALECLFLGLEIGLLADGLSLAAGGGEDLLGDAPGRLGPEP
jgi:hypothetical protein